MKISLQRTSPNYRQKLSTHTIMRDLTLGLLVIVAYSLFAQMKNGMNYVIAAALIYGVSVVTALVTEAVWAYIHKTNVLEQFKNSFPLVTSLIFALTLPVGTPLYVVAIGSFIAIFFGKLVYGGFGHNIFNPALVGRVVVHLSFGGKLVSYLPGAADAMTGATPATMLAGTSWVGSEAFTKAFSLLDLFLGNHGGTLGETCIAIILVVGVLLAYRRVFDARIPVAYIGTVAVLAGVFAVANGLNPLTYVATHLCIGGIVFGAVIMATDPVTSPTSPLGKILFGIGLGFLTMIIRFKANYPEGVLFSILLMNMLSPWIESLCLGRTNQKQAKQWAIIGTTLALSVGLVFGVGLTTKADLKAAAELAEQERLAAQAEAVEKAKKEVEAMNFELVGASGNKFTVLVDGFMDGGHQMKVEVEVDGDIVKSVKVLEFKGETEYFGLDLIEGIKTDGAAGAFYNKFMVNEFNVSELDNYNLYLKDDFKDTGKDDVDVYTGVTFTCKGIINAVKGAVSVSKIDKTVNGNTITFNLKSEGFGGEMSIKVVTDKATQKVTKVEVLEYSGETEGFGKDMIEGTATGKAKEFHDKYLAKSFSFNELDGVDTATGSTFTTKGIVSAIRQAIAASK